MARTRSVKAPEGSKQQLPMPDPILSEPAHRRMAIGAQRGIKVTAVFYLFTLIGFLITGGHLFDGKSFGVIDIGFMYFAWGLSGGALGGLAIPVARGWVSSIPVLALIFLPLAVAVRVLESGWSRWNAGDAVIILASSLFMGLLWGPLAWRQLHRKES